MAAAKRPPVTERTLQGLKYFQLLGPLLARLRPAGTERDGVGTRQWFFDHSAALLLLYFFSPTLTSLRGLQHASTLAKVQQRLGVRRTSLGALSEAAHVFDATLLREVVAELVGRVCAQPLPPADEAAVRGLIAVDGSLLRALPQMAWAVWQDERHRAAKLHVAFEVVRQLPIAVTVTAGKASERAELRRLVQPGGFYVFDRGYLDYGLFQELHELPCRFIGRVQDNACSEVQEARPVAAAAGAAGVCGDMVIRRLGTPHHTRLLPQPFRVVRVATGQPAAASPPAVVVLVTNRLDLAPELVALAYRYRWSVELFFRWFKCILGCRHLLSQGANGVALQVYAAVMASLLISLWGGRPPTKRTYEMLCHYFSGWANATEVLDYINRLHPKPPPPPSKR
jgi:Transposase DDE domain